MDEEIKKDVAGPILEIKGCYLCVVEEHFFSVDEVTTGLRVAVGSAHNS